MFFIIIILSELRATRTMAKSLPFSDLEKNDSKKFRKVMKIHIHILHIYDYAYTDLYDNMCYRYRIRKQKVLD